MWLVMRSVASVCLYVCLSCSLIFESLGLESSLLVHCWCADTPSEELCQVRMSGASDQGHSSKNVRTRVKGPDRA